MALGLEVQGLTKSFGKETILRDISFSLEVGKTGVIVGTSGVGKTTLLNIIAGVVRADTGRISIDGNVVEDSNEARVRSVERNIGYVFQDYLLFPHMSVFDNVAFGLRARHISSSTITEKVSNVLDAVGLSELRDKKPDQISGGQKQRISLARAMVLEPKLLLLDEPLSALDRQTREVLRVELKKIFTKLETTALYVTHDLDEAFFFGERIGIMRSGSLPFFGDKNALLTHMNRSTAEFLGFNLLKAQFLRLNGSDYVFLLSDWNCEVPLQLASQPELGAKDQIILAISPSSLRLSVDHDSGLVARVKEVWEFKDRVQIVVESREQKMISEISSQEFRELLPKPGDILQVVIGHAYPVSD